QERSYFSEAGGEEWSHIFRECRDTRSAVHRLDRVEYFREVVDLAVIGLQDCEVVDHLLVINNEIGRHSPLLKLGRHILSGNAEYAVGASLRLTGSLVLRLSAGRPKQKCHPY